MWQATTMDQPACETELAHSFQLLLERSGFAIVPS